MAEEQTKKVLKDGKAKLTREKTQEKERVGLGRKEYGLVKTQNLGMETRGNEG